MKLTLSTRRGEHRSSLTLLTGFRRSKGPKLLREESLKLRDHETRGGTTPSLLLFFERGSTLRLHEHDCSFRLRLEED